MWSNYNPPNTSDPAALLHGYKGDICLEASYLAAQDQDAGLVTFNNTSLCPPHPTGIAQSTTERLVKAL